MDMTGVIVILLVACLVVASVLLGLAVDVLFMFRKQRTKVVNRATESAEAVSEGPGNLPARSLRDLSSKLQLLRVSHRRSHLTSPARFALRIRMWAGKPALPCLPLNTAMDYVSWKTLVPALSQLLNYATK